MRKGNTKNKERESKEKIETKVKKKKKLNALDIITLSVIAILAIMYAPRGWSLYQDHKKAQEEAKKEPVTVYPLEVEITEQDTEFFVKYFKDYAIGITAANINLLDGEISLTDMVEFCRALLSKKYSSSGLISKSAMDGAILKYFDTSGVSYQRLGYKELAVYEDTDAKKIFNVTKMMQFEKDSNIYLVYADCVDKSKVQEETYKKEDIEDIYIFTFEKEETEKTEGSIVATEVKYILQKVEKEVIEEETEEVDEKKATDKNKKKHRN